MDRKFINEERERSVLQVVKVNLFYSPVEFFQLFTAGERQDTKHGDGK